MSIVDVNTNALKSTVRNNLDSVISGLESARSNAGSLLIPYDFKYCNYLLYDFWAEINKHINDFYDLKNWIDNSIKTFDDIGDEFADKSFALPTTNVKRDTINIKI